MASLGAAPWFDLALAILATWRLCHLVAREDGPFDLILRLRLRAGSGMVARLLDCPYCLSLWVAAPIAAWLARDLVTGLLLWQAISAGSCLLTMAADGLAAGASPAAPLAPPQLAPVSRALGPGRGAEACDGLLWIPPPTVEFPPAAPFPGASVHPRSPGRGLGR